jgi:hypothetical protein
VYCKGLRFTDRPKKRVALAHIGANQGRGSSIHYTFFGCKQCAFTYVRNVVVLVFFIEEGRIEAILGGNSAL